jgi:hypothetical protein
MNNQYYFSLKTHNYFLKYLLLNFILSYDVNHTPLNTTDNTSGFKVPQLCSHSRSSGWSSRLFVGGLDFPALDLGAAGFEGVALSCVESEEFGLVVLAADLLDVEVAEFAHGCRLGDLAWLVLALVLTAVPLEFRHLVNISERWELEELGRSERSQERQFQG